MQDWINLALVVALVALTAYYAIQTRKTVTVMEKSIQAQQMPRLALQVSWVGDFWSGVRISNVGAGPAMNADLSVEFVPRPTKNRSPSTTRFRVGLVADGRRISVRSPLNADGEIPDKAEFCRDFERVRLTGTVVDSLGQSHVVEEVLDDLRPYADLDESAVDIEDDLAHRALRSIGLEIHRLTREVKAVAESVGEPPPPEDDDVPF